MSEETTFAGALTGTATALVTHTGPCGPGNGACPHWAAPPDALGDQGGRG